jgi:glycosyltransferase involved in cell wall biosynthesis
MTVTVGIPTTGERPALRRAVESVVRSASRLGPGAEVLVVVNGSTSAPGLGRLDSPLLRVAHLPRRNLSLARNYILDNARNDTVLFADDDGVAPEPWCAELGGALREDGCAVVTAPVRVPVSGPVTALIDYQRIFDPPPAGPGEAHLLTGNCGLRRSMLPAGVRYDEHLPTAAEDVAFSFSLRAAGLRIRWLADATPGLHCVPEGIDQITERGLRYGRGGARLYLLRGGKLAVPGALSWYKAMASGEYSGYRRFPEFIWPGVRVVFTALEYMLNASMLAGYLDELGSQLGCRLVGLDSGALSGAFREVAARAGEGVARLPASDWNNLPADYRRMARDAEPPDPAQRITAGISEALRRHAPPVAAEPPAEVQALLEPSGAPGGPGAGGAGPAIAAQSAAARERLAAAWERLCQATGAISAADLERSIRGAGMPFRRGCQELEAMLRARAMAGN